MKKVYIYIFKDFISEKERMSERAQAGRAAEGEGEAGCPLSKEPHVELDPRTLGS